jgi:DNA gyrase inhibitor GyrI
MSLFKKFIIVFAVIIFFLFFALLIALWYLGAFASVKVVSEERGPYYIVTLAHEGHYQRIMYTIEQVDTMLKERGIVGLRAVALYDDNPAAVLPDQLQSRGGFIVRDSVKVDSPFVLQKIEQRSVAIAAIKAHPTVAPFKTYPALYEWINRKGYEVITEQPILELYHDKDLVEVEMSILVK